MSNKAKTPTLPEPVADVEDRVEDRVDQFAQGRFFELGFQGRLPDKLVEAYTAFKETLNKQVPARRLTPEGFAAVVAIYRLMG